MRVLVLGGTRFLSRTVAATAAARGHEVTAACRGSNPVPDGVTHVAYSSGDLDMINGPADVYLWDRLN